jgi:hypothetical protein
MYRPNMLGPHAICWDFLLSKGLHIVALAVQAGCMCLHRRVWDIHTPQQLLCRRRQVLHRIPSTVAPISSYIRLSITMDRCHPGTRPVHIMEVPDYLHIKRAILLKGNRSCFLHTHKKREKVSIYQFNHLCLYYRHICDTQSDMGCG